MKTRYCHSDAVEFTSPLSINAIRRNTSTELHLLPSKDGFDVAAIQAIGREFHDLAKKDATPFWISSDREKDLTLRMSEVSSLESYAALIDDITSDFDKSSPSYPFMESFSQDKGGRPDYVRKPRPVPRKAETAFSRMSAMLLRLWSADQLGIAPKWANETRQFCDISQLTAGAKISLMNEVEPSLELVDRQQDKMRMRGLLFRLSSNSIGIRQVDDIVPGSVPKEALDLLGNRTSALLKLIRANQLLRHPSDIVPQTPLWHGKWGKRTRGDNTLAWAAADKIPELAMWHECILGWLATRPAQGPALKGAESFINYLIKHPDASRDPAEFLARSYKNPNPISVWLQETFEAQRALFDVNNLIEDIFSWTLIERLSAHDDHGRPITSPNHWNPLSRMSKKPAAVQTHREAIPTRYIREMVQIITENDFEWCKRLPMDHIPLLDPEANQWVKVWSPVRATAMLLKLLLPLRTFQVCMLDSGELDEEVCVNGHWIKNPSPLAMKKRRMGALRKFIDRSTGRISTGFYINTNKTADNGKMSADRGYEIPWEHAQAISALSNLVEWQKTVNPLAKAQRWDEIHDAHLLRDNSMDGLAKRGPAAFLFRDPAGSFKNDPITTARIQSFWVVLLRELQNRVAARGETMPDGSTIAFVSTPTTKERDGNRSYQALYDLHSLRVSLITALATEGGVPIPILSKCIAGHASILMTLYYVKIGAPMMNEQLAHAQKCIDENEQENFKRFIFEKDAKIFKPLVAINDEAGFAALEQKNIHLWSINDKGICPVGGALCHIGGPKTTKNTQVGDYAPVPGGPRNCVRCRFFVTGPAFLGGLVAHFNAVGIELMEASDRHRQKEAAIQKLEDELYELGGNDAKLLDRIKMAQDRQEEEMKEIDAIASNWHAIYAFIERSKAIIARTRTEGQSQGVQLTPSDPMSKQGLAQAQNLDELGAQQNLNKQGELSLVLGGDEVDFGVVMQEASRFETFNSVCQMAVAYPAEKAIPLANLRRSKLLDAMLSRNNCNPVFASLSDEEAMAVGNQLSTLLIARLGRVETANLIEGRRMLESSGVFKDVQNIVKQHASLGFLPKDAQPTPTPAKKLGRPRKSTNNDKESS